jgi:ubiquinone/menaquinone biosynthesis C-methylase UbiE
MQDHETVIRKEFSRQADAMAKAALFNDESVLARIREAARLTNSSRVLDVACGTGLITFRAADAAGPRGTVVATDIAEQMVDHVQKVAAERGSANITARMIAALPINNNMAATHSKMLTIPPSDNQTIRRGGLGRSSYFALFSPSAGGPTAAT